jgi:hypothetical protein
MDKSEIEAILGRSLTPTEDTNFTTYINIANENLENLICTPFEEITETRLFNTRHDYKTAFVDIFWQITEVKLDGNITTDYTVRQWDNRNGSWYNSLVFENYLEGKELEVTADWGFPPVSDASSLPYDLQQVLAGLFAQITKKNKFNPTVASKQNREYRISFRADVDLDDEFYKSYGKTIAKYSLCNIPDFKQGKVGC